MGWLSAGSGTLIVAYLIYVAIVGLAARQAEAKHTEAKHTAHDDSTTSQARTTSNAKPVISLTPEEPNASSTPTPGGPTPKFQRKEEPAIPVRMTPPPSPPPPPPPPTPPSRAPPQQPSRPQIQPPPPPPPRPPTVRSSSPPRLKPPAMSAPPRPGPGFLRPPPSAAASLRVPQTKALSNTHMQPASSTLGVPKKRSRQVTLGPGYSPLDWAALTSNPNSGLRGKDAPDHLIRVTPSQLKKQTGRKGKDAWTVYQGRVYNITPYLPFHPGGVAELMKGAGRDSGALFMEVHPWVNWDGMLAECLVGVLVAEDDANADTNKLDEMD